MRKSAFCIYEYKGADQLHGNLAVDLGLCICYSSHLLWLHSLICARLGQKFKRYDFLMMWLIQYCRAQISYFVTKPMIQRRLGSARSTNCAV